MPVSAAGSLLPAAALAKPVQITQVDNFIDSVNGVNLLDDLTGDGTSDWGGTGNIISTLTTVPSVRSFFGVNITTLGNDAIVAYWASNTTSMTVYAVGVANGPALTGTTRRSLSALVSFTFSDGRINGGAPTDGFVEVRLRNEAKQRHIIELTRLIFDDASTAAPGGVAAGGVNPPFDPGVYALRASLQRKITAQKRKLKRARKAKNKAKLKSIRRKLRKFQVQLRNA